MLTDDTGNTTVTGMDKLGIDKRIILVLDWLATIVNCDAPGSVGVSSASGNFSPRTRLRERRSGPRLQGGLTMEKQEIATILREFILEQSNLADSSVLHDDTNLIEAGILDSLMMASVVWFCEERLNCSLDTADLTEDSCKSITAMSGLISRKHRNTGNLNG